MTQFLKMFRGVPGPPPAAPPPLPQQGFIRRSTGFEQFTAHIASPEGLSVLDLGPTSPRNIGYLTALGHKVYNEDVLLASADPAMRRPAENGNPPALDVERFFAENLLFCGRQFDAVLCWDIPDFLEGSLVKPMVERLASVTRPGGVLLAFFHTHEAGAEAPHVRYHIASDDSLDLRPSPPYRLQRVFNNRHIENLFSGFKSLKFFLARDHIREVLAVR